MLEEIRSLTSDVVKREWGLVCKGEKEKTNIIPFVKKDGIAIIASVADVIIGVLCKPEFSKHMLYFTMLDVRRLTYGRGMLRSMHGGKEKGIADY